MPVNSIDKSNVTDLAFEQMRSAIASGEWKPGDKIPSEVDLTKMMGVSRVTVRAALQKLASLGLVSRQQGRGTIVCTIDGSQQINKLIPVIMLDKPDLNYMNEFRIILECGAAELAAQNRTEEQLEKLKANYEQMRVLEQQGEDYSNADVDFHILIAEASQNPLILQTMQIMRETFLACMQEYKRLLDNDPCFEAHKRIIEAITDRNPRVSRKLMMEHLKVNVRTVKRKA